ncbi:flavodoxin FldA [Thermocoleostomius sinensis]|uniref:Flavodoxin n=1 Tax=Thermocoleostomius sinensis A174 TaxID=2016057 RepID=A0A9E8ZFE7_9CYAN|nr:flavodoxin FldA [Thermocoleostomius sinensis]WAL62158.1 flavodoxin FldA [Thermocoleostomius sinensis A174]
MVKIGLFYGTETGITEILAICIQKEFGGDKIVDLHNVVGTTLNDFEEYDRLIIGCPTWNIGDLQTDWRVLYNELDAVDFSGKQIAYFGAGDQLGYENNFVDAIGILEAKISALGGVTVGYWSIDGYDFCQSKAVKNGKFVGLPLDELNQPDLTQERIKAWVAQLQREFGL